MLMPNPGAEPLIYCIQLIYILATFFHSAFLETFELALHQPIV